jgi:abequosyltransferase
MSQIKLSICIATLNRSAFIAATLESIISQATDEVEIVVLDGGSSDGTQLVIQQFQNRFPRLRYFRQDTNNGVDQDFATAVELAHGEYCWLFSDDDLLLPGAIKSALDAIRTCFAVLIANAEVRDVDMAKVLVPKVLPFNADKIYRPAESQLFLADVANYMTFIGCVIIKRQFWCAGEKNKYFGSHFVHVGVVFHDPLPADACVLSRPLISVRYGNAMWLAKYFEIWMFKWPSLIWSFAHFSDSVKVQVCPKEPWRRIRTLLIHRAKGTYGQKEYVQYLEPRLKGRWKRAASQAIAYLPGRLANFMALAYYSIFCHGVYQRLALVDLRNSPFYCFRFQKRQTQMLKAGTAKTVEPIVSQ